MTNSTSTFPKQAPRGHHDKDWLDSPEERRAAFDAYCKAKRKIDAQAEACRRKAERKREGERIADMEARGYRFTGFGPDGEMNFTKGKAEVEQPEGVLTLANWRERRHAR